MVKVTNIPLRTSGPRRQQPRPAIPVQARTAEQDVEFARRMECSKCQITYYAELHDAAKCPLCDAERRIMELQQTIHGMRNEIENLHDSSVRMQASLDTVTALKNATELLDHADLTFLKSVLYRVREDHTSMSLRATRGGKDASVNGFMVDPRQGEPEAHACSSIGGVAIAAYYEEMSRKAGTVKALVVLTSALSNLLAPGG